MELLTKAPEIVMVWVKMGTNWYSELEAQPRGNRTMAAGPERLSTWLKYWACSKGGWSLYEGSYWMHSCVEIVTVKLEACLWEMYLFILCLDSYVSLWVMKGRTVKHAAGIWRKLRVLGSSTGEWQAYVLCWVWISIRSPSKEMGVPQVGTVT